MADGPTMRFDDQVAIITGGAGGLGSTYARLLASRGAKVVVNDIGVTIEGEPMDPPPGDGVVEEIVANGGEAISDTHNVIDEAPAIVAAAVEAYGKVDIVITSHLVHRAGPFGELPLEEFEFGNENDYHGTVRVMHAAWAELAKTGGRALLTGSGSVFGVENLSSYITSKGGVIALARALGLDGRQHGIRVNAVLPFAGTRQGLAMPGFSDFMTKHATPQQVANGVLWLVQVMILGKLGPALGAGNTTVLKPSAQAPQTALLLAQLAHEETEIPPGVLNIVIGESPDLGRTLVADPRVGMIAFTGSAAVGRAVGVAAAERFAKVVLELGGKSASIVLDDADAVAAARASVVRVCLNGGQGCTNLTRLLVPSSEYEAVLEAAAETCGEIVWGDPSELETQLGPMITRQHQERVLGYVKRAVDGGARLVGGAVEPPRVEHGYFVPPTVLADVAPDAEIAQEEVFGPVLAIFPYEGGDDGAVELANNSHYGLGGAIFSGSDERGLEVARRVYTGVLDVNGASCRGADVPFGGCKDSGLGREGGVIGFEEYLETRMIGVPRA